MILGFAEKCNGLSLLIPFLPDKIGGRPAWLDYEHPPNFDDLKCPICQQIYCPIEEKPCCFHRYLYIFMCINGECYSSTSYSSPFIVKRCQLARTNPYIEYDPSPALDQEATVETVSNLMKLNRIINFLKFNNVCSLCGVGCSEPCPDCKIPHYCCEEHSENENGERGCRQNLENLAYEQLIQNIISPNKYVLPEFCLESEEIDNQASFSGEESDDDFPTSNNEEIKAIEEICRKPTHQDKIVRRLKKLMSGDPDQVVRLNRGGEMYWLNCEEEYPKIPNCRYCDSPMVHELQVTSRILSHLKLDQLNVKTPDFGLLSVFTCSNSCSPTDSAKPYLQEFVLCQYI